MAELVDHAQARLAEITSRVKSQFATKNQPHCSCCGAVRAVYGKKKERKLCRPCMYLSEAEQQDKTLKYLFKVLIGALEIEAAEAAVQLAKKQEVALDELLRREIEESRPRIEPTGLRVVAGKEYLLEVTAQRFRRYLTKGR